MYICKHFEIHELVPPSVYEKRGQKAWELLDERALITLDTLRDHFGVCTVNNYHFGGSRKWSGLRTPESPYYSETSQHSLGKAFDCIFKEVTAEEVRQYILSHRSEFPHITGLELDVSWLHFDVRNTNPIKVFSA